MPTILLPFLAWLAAAVPPLRAPEEGTAPLEEAQAPKAGKPAQQEGWVTIDRGEGFDPLRIPRDERLDFEVSVDTFLGDISAGTVKLSSGTEPYNPGLPFSGGAPSSPSTPASDPSSSSTPGPTAQGSSSGSPPTSGATKSAKPESAQVVGWIRSVAEGSYLGYTLHHELEVRHLPQVWPHSMYSDRQSGSENRQREIKLGVLEGKPTAAYRSDGHCKGCSNPEHFIESAWAWGKPYHCEKCKRAEHRVWDPQQTRAVPAGTVDLLTAVYLARALVRDGGPPATFPVLDRMRLWNVTIQRGETKSIEVPSGTYRCVSVQLKTAVPPSEKPDKDGFSGLFGIRGTIKIWFEEKTGVPVMISGELPVPVIKHLEVNVKLAAHHGTPPEFQPVPADK